jgi:two-component system, LytTR family, sensor kinase
MAFNQRMDFFKIADRATGTNISLLRQNRLLGHILFWVWVYLMDVFIFGSAYQQVKLFFTIALIEMPGQLFFAYSVMYWLLPRHMRRKNDVETALLLLALLLITGVISQTFFTLVQTSPEPTSFWDVPKFFMRVFYCFLKGCIFIVLKFMMMWYENQQKITEIEKTRVESELKLLKDQVNPHFMFNTLNNLYGLIGKNPIHAQESVLGFSGILHYMLYETNNKFVPLQREVKCIEDYIELEKLRYSGTLSVSMNVDPQTLNLSVVPLTIFPFVENSFKHGASELINDAWINIEMSVHENTFFFKIENSKQFSNVQGNHKGIGLLNVKRRLELIYGERHTLQLFDSNERYLAVLKIDLDAMKPEKSTVYENEMSYR